ncbi:PdaC/SigV domain-containing protein [Paenibacillus lactis]|uniref:Copper amine oxidase-like domain-containing protein n=1 Tax=Paenibacillus lactis 154 TaxID=743719 RepID=G4HPF3_9BACL|nr:DUF4163 domain-containing protein [Paenibacillus lactis]EHB48598.1 hypothetical protein PaelaDRAFT_5864 [Paenibacillus lactis 154]
MNSKFRVCATIIATGVLLGSLGLNGQVIDASPSKPSVSASHNVAKKNEVTLKWNGKTLSQKGVLLHGVTYIPATVLRDAAGMPLKYDSKNRTYTLNAGYHQLSAVVYDSKEIGLLVNGLYAGEPGGQILNGRLYLPFKTVSEYLGIQGQWSPSSKTLSLTKKQSDLTIKSETLKKTIQGVEAAVSYPVVSGLSNGEAQTQINSVLKKHAESVIARAEESIKELPPGEDSFPYAFEGNFVVHYNKDGLLSVMAHDYSYLGGAHGMTFKNSFTFSLKDGKLLKLGDFIDLKGKKKKLDNRVLSELKKGGGYLGGFEGVPEDAEFYLKDNAVVLYFQLYEYTAYAYGFPEFELKLKEWK